MHHPSSLLFGAVGSEFLVAIRQGKVKLDRGQLGEYVELEGIACTTLTTVDPAPIRKQPVPKIQIYALVKFSHQRI